MAKLVMTDIFVLVNVLGTDLSFDVVELGDFWMTHKPPHIKASPAGVVSISSIYKKNRVFALFSLKSSKS